MDDLHFKTPRHNWDAAHGEALKTPTFKLPYACTKELQAANKPYPKTCAICGLGPCQNLQFEKIDTTGMTVVIQPSAPESPAAPAAPESPEVATPIGDQTQTPDPSPLLDHLADRVAELKLRLHKEEEKNRVLENGLIILAQKAATPDDIKKTIHTLLRKAWKK